jgi:ketosteroid isomerase-like protein
MEVSDRNELVDTYYEAVDREDWDLLLSAFSPAVTYVYPGEGELHGHDEVRAFFAERRQTTNSTHELFRRIHGENGAACEGHITADLKGGGSVDGNFVGVFTFDDDAGRIDYVGVYTQL